MIEQYCGCLSENLSTMCKERECPKEAMEAAATLIFAAARFSDLPELTDLRSVFTKRYGTRMESCIDKEFVDKTQKKSFSKARKLQLMEDIAQEFSVNWNSYMFENKMFNQPAPTHPKAMEHQLVSKENLKQQHQIQQNEQKDFQTTPANVIIHAHDTIKKIVKMKADELEDAKSDLSNKKSNAKTKYNQNEGIGLIATEKQPSAGVVYRDFKASETIPPPYTKLTVGSNGTIADHGDLAHSEASEDVKEVDHRPVNDSSRRTFNFYPPYTKPKLNNTPNDANYVNPTEYEKSNGVQGNMPKDETFEDDSHLVSQIQTKQGRETARTNGIHGDAYDGQRFVIKQTSSSRRRHDRRRAVEIAEDGGYDKEEEIMDKLLMHYSKKGTDDEPRRTRTKRRGAPKEPIADAARVLEHFDEHKRHPHTLPRELTIPTK